MKDLRRATRDEIVAEVKRVEQLAVKVSKNKKLQQDYKKHLSRLHNELRCRAAQY